MRRWIFQTLMSNRATRMNEDFVRALNLIDLEFIPRRIRGGKDRAVVNAWRSLFGEYHETPGDKASEEEMKAWNCRIDDRLVSLLMAMSKTLQFDFSDEQLRRGIYYPRGRIEMELTQQALLNGLRQAVEGKLAIPMKITEFPNSPELLAAQIALTENSAKAYGEDGALKVRIQGEISGVRTRPVRP